MAEAVEEGRIDSIKSFSFRHGIKTCVMVNGLPGKMASKIVEHIQSNNRLCLVPFSLTGPEIDSSSHSNIELIRPTDREYKMKNIINDYSPFITVDYTHLNAVNSNADFYCKNKLPFVMGTTGGDIEVLEEIVKNSKISAVIAPNMAKQIVAFQAMIKYASENFPEAFKGYSLEIKKSYQRGKVDTNGTTKAMIEYFDKLGIPFTKERVITTKDIAEQLELGIPDNALIGYGWHTYTLKSGDGVLFQFTYNVNRKDVYTEGTIDAVNYLDKKVKEGNKGKIYSMIDVLSGK